MKRVVITGANGRIGSVLRERLAGCEIVPLDLPDVDVRDRSSLDPYFEGADAVVHLAYEAGESSREFDNFQVANSQMAFNVYAAAMQHRLRVVMASSVHADICQPQPDLLTTETVPVPDSPYGANKVLAEALGRYYATRGLEVVAIRFGGVNVHDAPPLDDERERQVWLSHRDCAALVERIIKADAVPGGYQCLYAVSDNQGRFHDISNPFGWHPGKGGLRQ